MEKLDKQFYEPMSKTLYDYFKVSYNWKMENDSLSKQLFDILKVDIDKYIEDSSSRDNMQEHRIYDQNVHMYFNPNSSAARAGVLTFFTLEMTGQACREFELRGGNWEDLVNFTEEHDHKALIIHLTKDDFNGCVDFDTLKDKILKEEFISSFRRSRKIKVAPKCRIETSSGTPYLEADKRFYGSDIMDMRKYADEDTKFNIVTKEGWSATFGVRELCQLQIYDKKVERVVNSNYTSPYKSWIRFEMRFGSLKADRLLTLIYKAYKVDKCIDILTSKLLYNLLDFKDNPQVYDKEHLYMCETWESWLIFLFNVGDIDKIKVNQSLDYEPSITKSINWILNSARVWLKVYAVDNGVLLNNTIFRGIANKLNLGKLDNRLMSEINNYLLSLGLEPKEHLDTLKYLHAIFKDYGDEELEIKDIVHKSIDMKKVVFENDEDEENFYDEKYYTDDEDLPF